MCIKLFFELLLFAGFKNIFELVLATDMRYERSRKLPLLHLSTVMAALNMYNIPQIQPTQMTSIYPTLCLHVQ